MCCPYSSRCGTHHDGHVYEAHTFCSRISSGARNSLFANIVSIFLDIGLYDWNIIVSAKSFGTQARDNTTWGHWIYAISVVLLDLTVLMVSGKEVNV